MCCSCCDAVASAVVDHRASATEVDLDTETISTYIYALSSHFYPSGKYIRLLASLVEMLLGFFVCLSVESFNPPPGW